MSAKRLHIEEETAFAFLQRYARECTQRQCEDLLKFCTGSNQIVVKNIQVFFAASEAREPLPRAHTCGPVIEIPVPGYPLYDAFKAAFDALLVALRPTPSLSLNTMNTSLTHSS